MVNQSECRVVDQMDPWTKLKSSDGHWHHETQIRCPSCKTVNYLSIHIPTPGSAAERLEPALRLYRAKCADRSCLHYVELHHTRTEFSEDQSLHEKILADVRTSKHKMPSTTLLAEEIHAVEPLTHEVPTHAKRTLQKVSNQVGGLPTISWAGPEKQPINWSDTDSIPLVSCEGVSVNYTRPEQRLKLHTLTVKTEGPPGYDPLQAPLPPLPAATSSTGALTATISRLDFGNYTGSGVPTPTSSRERLGNFTRSGASTPTLSRENLGSSTGSGAPSPTGLRERLARHVRRVGSSLSLNSRKDIPRSHPGDSGEGGSGGGSGSGFSSPGSSSSRR